MSTIDSSSSLCNFFYNRFEESKLSYLPSDYQPGRNDVILGRGKKCYNHEGNMNLRSIVASRLDEYSTAISKREKSKVIEAVIMQIQTGDPNGKFVKHNATNKLWFEVGHVLAKEKTSQAFRDALVGLYRSSNDFKKKRRRAMRKNENNARLQPVESSHNQDKSLAKRRAETDAGACFLTSLSHQMCMNEDLFSISSRNDVTPATKIAPANEIVPLEPTFISNMIMSDFVFSDNILRFIASEKNNSNNCHESPSQAEDLEDFDTSNLVPKGLDLSLEQKDDAYVNCFHFKPNMNIGNAKMA